VTDSIPITFRSDVTVELIKSDADDQFVVQTAKVSTLAEKTLDLAEIDPHRFIAFLMEGRHGSPFEHLGYTFFIQAPIFVFREFMRHRIASYNEESGRYKQLKPVFYIPADDRNLQQVGKTGAYQFVPGTPEQIAAVGVGHRQASALAYKNYQELLDLGVAKEVARMSLPLNIYSSAYVTINARSLMNFLSLRTKRTKEQGAAFESTPQREIEMVADLMEAEFARLMPATHAAFDRLGRVAP
jgi:thymidylate synthase (FAD)